MAAPLTYVGIPLSAGQRQLLNDLRRFGCASEVTSRSNNATTGSTFQIFQDGRKIGYINDAVINRSALVGYHFAETGSNSCPPQLASSLESWACSRFSCGAHDVVVHHGQGSNGHRTFLLIKSYPVVLRAFGLQTGTASDETLLADIASLADDLSRPATTRQALIEARLGQGAFRDALLFRYHHACAVSGISLGPLLRASHIQPWRKSNDTERLDPDNGILLSANLDALFDRGFITFMATGAACLSPLIGADTLSRLGEIGNLRVPPNTEQSVYLEFHAQHVFREN